VAVGCVTVVHCAKCRPSTIAEPSSSELVYCPSASVSMHLASVKESGATKFDKRRCKEGGHGYQVNGACGSRCR
jgi:hypothetical protein